MRRADGAAGARDGYRAMVARVCAIVFMRRADGCCRRSWQLQGRGLQCLRHRAHERRAEGYCGARGGCMAWAARGRAIDSSIAR